MNKTVLYVILSLMGVGALFIYFTQQGGLTQTYVDPDQKKCESLNGTFDNIDSPSICSFGNKTDTVNEYLIGCGENMRVRYYTNNTITAQLPNGGILGSDCFLIKQEKS